MLRYTGRAFRQQQGVSLSALARGVQVRRATLIALEQNRPDCINRQLVGRIAVWWREQGVACEVVDLLEIVEPAIDAEDAPPYDV